MKLKKDSWYGKHVGHIDNWCGLVWGSLWRTIAGVVIVTLSTIYALAMTVGNYNLIFHLNAHIMEQDQVMLRTLIAAAIALDVMTVIALIAVAAGYSKEIGEFIRQYTEEYCPKVEWE